MAFNLAQKFVSLGMASPLATEYSAQLQSGVYNWRRLVGLGMIPSLAKYTAESLNEGTFNPKRAMELSMEEAVAALTNGKGGGPIIDQPSNWGLSWHEEPLKPTVAGGSYLVGSDETGRFFAQETRSDGTGKRQSRFTPLISRIDDHNAISVLKSTSGSLLVAMCGHGDTQYQPGAIVNEIRIARAASGLLPGLPVDRSNQIIISLPSGELPNYLQWHQITSGPFAGRILLFYVEDISVCLRCYFSDDDGITWTRGRRISSSGAVGQIYFRVDSPAVFTGSLPVSGYSSTFLPLYVWVHPNSSVTSLRYVYIDLATGRIYRPDTGAAALSGTATIFDQTSQNTVITAYETAETALRNIRTPAAGRSQRTHMVYRGVACFSDFTASPAYGDARHIVNKNGIDYDLGAVGAPFQQSRAYMPDIQPGMESYTGDRIYRCYNNGSAYNSGSKLDRIDYPTGIQNGGAVTTNILSAGTGPVASDEAIMRYFPIRGAGATGLVGWAWVGKYVDYYDWSQCRFIPVII